MLTFDPNSPRSVEAPTLYHLRALISTCAAWQEICERPTEAAALAKIILGRHDDPWEGAQYTEEQLAEIFAECHLIPPPSGRSVIGRGTGGPQAETGGVFLMTIRRYVRPSEEDLGALYLGFLDAVAALEVEIIETADQRECPRLRFVEPLAGPAYGARNTETAQGRYLWAQHNVHWGDEVDA